MNGHRFGYAVVVGRFQPFHNGHLALVRTAFAIAERVVVVPGSANRARSPRHPFTESERERMIRAAVEQAEPEAAPRLEFLPLRDFYDEPRWVAAVAAGLAQIQGRHPEVAPTTCLVGHFEDESVYYARNFAEWTLHQSPTLESISGTALRSLYFGREDRTGAWLMIESAVPPPVAAFLHAFARLPEYEALAEAHAHIEAGKAAWRSAPYPPVFVTVDALVRCHGHVLLVKRAHHPGKGLWALPGGFLDQRERLVNAALRELKEETGLALLPAYLEERLQGSRVFDDPDRSERGRTITHAFFFDLSEGELPIVKGADDAAEARWIAVDELAAMECVLFDDHFEIANTFLGLI